MTDMMMHATPVVSLGSTEVAEPKVEITVSEDQTELSLGSGSPDAMDVALGEMMGDAPACPTCGHITVRNGACYKCLNCGDSLGCS